MKRLALALAVALVCANCGVALAQQEPTCPAVRTERVTDGKRTRDVVHADAFIFYSAGLRVNTDGAPNSYHPLGRVEGGALNTICNGIAVRPSDGPYRDRRITALHPASMTMAQLCQKILDIFRVSAAADYEPVGAGSIEWYALAREQREESGRKGKPCIQKDGPYKGFFVAQTALAADPALDSCNVDRWLNSNTIPYVTLPSGSEVFGAAGSNLGDLALVHRVVDSEDVWVVAVVGDTGNELELGEGSIALHRALGQKTPPGRRYPGNISDGVTTFLFPGARASIPLSEKSLSDPSVRQELFKRAGGEAILLACMR